MACHERRPDSGHEVLEQPEHRAQTKKVRYGIEPVRQTFLALGEATEEFLAGLQTSFPRNSGYHARYILQLKETYHCDDIYRALVHAMRYHAHDSMAIERILKTRFRPRTLEQCLHRRSAEQLHRALPQVGQRPLSEYDVLLGTKKPHPPDSSGGQPPQKEEHDGTE